MRIAVTYDNGNVFGHFGKTEFFKIYDVDGNKILSSEVISTNGTGHEALAGFLADKNVNIVICGGLGAGAMNALVAENIQVFSGAEGDADTAVNDYLNGSLTEGGVNCDHHDQNGDHECHCGSHDEGAGCGHGCCCGEKELQILFEGPNAGKTCKVHYTGTYNDGTVFDSSLDRNEPLEFICGVGMMIKGFDEAVVNMNVGEKKDIHLMPEDAYGMPDPSAVFNVPIANMPGAEDFNIGDKAYLESDMGQPFLVTVKDKTDDMITLDANHEMAGKELNFHIELISAE